MIKAKQFEPDHVIIMFGANAAKDVNFLHVAEFAHDLHAMVDYFKQIPSLPKVWVCKPLPILPRNSLAIVSGNFETNIKQQIIKVSQEDKDITLVDVYGVFRRASTKLEHLLLDGVHPNAEGSKMIADEIFDKIERRAKLCMKRVINCTKIIY
eukprot:gene1092-1646_t